MVMKRLYQIKEESIYIEGEKFKVTSAGHLNRPSQIKSVETGEIRDIGFAVWVETENLKKELIEEIKEVPDEEVWIVDEEAEKKAEKNEKKVEEHHSEEHYNEMIFGSDPADFPTPKEEEE